MGKSIHEYKILVKYFFNLVRFSWNIFSINVKIFLLSTYGKEILDIGSLKKKFSNGYCQVGQMFLHQFTTQDTLDIRSSIETLP